MLLRLLLRNLLVGLRRTEQARCVAYAGKYGDERDGACRDGPDGT